MFKKTSFCIHFNDRNIRLILNQRGRRGRDRMVVGFIMPMQSVSITTKVVRSNPAHGEVYSIQYLRNKSWKPECVLSFNMGWRISVFYPEPEARDISTWVGEY
jgi:hypothetical protein